MEDEITKDDFMEYENIRLSGKTNMFDTNKVIELSGNLNKNKIVEIMENYSEFKNLLQNKNGNNKNGNNKRF